MEISDIVGKVQTVLGPIDPDDLGFTLTHEHIFKEGYLERILISHDTAFKHCLSCYGGRGYAHINENVIPLMHAKGITEEQIHTITVENPKRLLTFAEPVE